MSWLDIYSTADALNEKFQNVFVETLKGHFMDKVFELAVSRIHKDPPWRGFDDELNYQIKHVISAKLVKVAEFVEITPQRIRVVIDKPTINEETIIESLNRVVIALDSYEGNTLLYFQNFDDHRSFTYEEIPWLYTH